MQLGLWANWQQFWLLVLVNAFVGSMVGLERSVLPLLAEQEFGIASKTAVLSFLVGFGIVKAVSNALAGFWADQWGRKKVLVIGWLLGCLFLGSSFSLLIGAGSSLPICFWERSKVCAGQRPSLPKLTLSVQSSED